MRLCFCHQTQPEFCSWAPATFLSSQTCLRFSDCYWSSPVRALHLVMCIVWYSECSQVFLAMHNLWVITQAQVPFLQGLQKCVQLQCWHLFAGNVGLRTHLMMGMQKIVTLMIFLQFLCCVTANFQEGEIVPTSRRGQYHGVCSAPDAVLNAGHSSLESDIDCIDAS